MGSSKEAYNAEGRGQDLWNIRPENLVLVTDTNHILFDPRVLWPTDEALVASIMEDGIIEPVIIRKNGKRGEKGVIEVVDGRQRVKAALEANKRLKAKGAEEIFVPCLPRSGTDLSAFEAMVSTFIRKDDTPMSRAIKIDRYLKLGRSHKQAATKFGCTEQTIKNLLDLLELHPKVQEAIEEGLSTNVARELAKSPREDQPAELKKLVEAGATRGKQGVDAAQDVRRTGAVREPVKRVKMMTRRTVEKWRDEINGLDTAQAKLAAAVLSCVLGNRRTIGDYEAIAQLLKDVTAKKKKAKAA